MCDLVCRCNRKYFIFFLLVFLYFFLCLFISLVIRFYFVFMVVGDLGEGFILSIVSVDVSKNMSKESVICLLFWIEF